MRHGGFTLVEVIVVISILAFMMAILSPVLSRSRERARITLCASRIDNILLSLRAYDAANGSLPCGFDGPHDQPPPGGYAGSSAMDLVGWYWFNHAEVLQRKSVREFRVLQCPSKRLEDAKLNRDVLHGNYGVNLSLCKMYAPFQPYDVDEFQGAPLSTDTVRRPGETLLVADSGYALVCWWNATKESPAMFGNLILDTTYVPGLEINGGKIVLPGETTDAVGGRHPGKTINVGFVDGHVSQSKASQLLVDKIGDDMWNNSPVWCPK